MSKLVTIYGGSGFIGRYIARRMAKCGWRVRVAVRHPNEAMFVKPYGNVGQVEPILCNIRDDASVAAALDGADAVVNCVGLLAPSGKNTFHAVQVEGAERIARLAQQAGIQTMVHLSAIGANPDAESLYSRTKAQGEAAVLRFMPDAVILRPSIVFGPEDEFFNRFAGLSRLGPVLPVIGGKTLFQPVYVDDVAQAAVQAVIGQAEAGIYELGGPEVLSFQSMMEKMLQTVQRRRIILNIPFFAATLMAKGFDLLETITLGLIKNPAATADQVKSLKHDNVVSDGSMSFDALGIAPTAMETVLPEYLWRFRPSGQYAAIKNSASNLRT